MPGGSELTPLACCPGIPVAFIVKGLKVQVFGGMKTGVDIVDDHIEGADDKDSTQGSFSGFVLDPFRPRECSVVRTLIVEGLANRFVYLGVLL